MWLVPFVLVLTHNVMVWLVFGFDKHRAKTGGRRVSERTLWSLAWAFGAPGAWLGMRTFRHKTKKPRFVWGMPVLLAVQLVVAVGIAVRRPELDVAQWMP